MTVRKQRWIVVDEVGNALHMDKVRGPRGADYLVYFKLKKDAANAALQENGKVQRITIEMENDK